MIDPSRWARGPAFDAILSCGRVEEDDAWRTFNMGVGMCLIVPEGTAEACASVVPDARPIGRVVAGETGVVHGRL
jgi:phosphoribosylformylglycinamidine cyclo-ligase